MEEERLQILFLLVLEKSRQDWSLDTVSGVLSQAPRDKNNGGLPRRAPGSNYRSIIFRETWRKNAA
jgi:hypothetical protein